MPQPTQRSSSPPREKPVPSYPIPRSAADAFGTHKSKSPQNAGLIFDRFAPDTRDSNEAKRNGFTQVVDAEKKADTQLLTALNTRWTLDAKSVNGELFKYETDWRFITGLGRKGPLEAGFTFNRYGFPILPGSSVKGIARAYAFYKLAETLKTNELGTLDKILSEDDEKKFREAFAKQSADEEAKTYADNFRVIFGTTSDAGRAIFLDAIPTHVPELQLDIMNPHFPDYYGDDPKRPTKYPTDWQSPRPVFFLTVAANTEFCFAVGWRGKADESLHQLAQEWLKRGLQELGAGAKTSAGYGYFKPEENKARQEAQVEHAQAEEVVQTVAPVAVVQPTRPTRVCSGVIVKIVSDRRGFGFVRDGADNREYRFQISAIQGQTPGRNDPVEFELVGDKVVKVRKM
jgi:CRISPR-associated protein Cmr6